MSREERKELTALAAWLKTFPEVEEALILHDDLDDTGYAWVSAPELVKPLIQAATEIFDCDAKSKSKSRGKGKAAQDDEVWSVFHSMVYKGETIASDHEWQDDEKHSLLSSLLDAAVSHKSLDLRKAYIERIMGLPPSKQRALMALIERRKRQAASAKKTPSKGTVKVTQSSQSSSIKRSHSKSSGSMKSPAPSNKKLTRPSPDAGGGSSPQSHFKTPDKGGRPRTRSNQRLFASPPPSTGQGSRRNYEEAFGASPATMASVDQSAKRMAASRSNRRSLMSPGLGDSAVYEKEVQELRDANKQLDRDLKNAVQREEELQLKVEEMEVNFRKEMIRVEASSRRREEETQDQYQEEIEALRAELETIRVDYDQAQKAKEELAGIKDDMDLMLHTKNQLAETTEKLQTYKEKVQQLSDVKEALQREEQAHGKSVEECLRLQNEVNTLQPLKRQLDEYKARAVEAEFKFTEARDELLKAKQDKLKTSQDDEELSRVCQTQREEIEELKRRLAQEEESKADRDSVGEGVSELNPELKEEVMKLRNENARLKEFAAKHQDDAVEKLEQELDHEGRMSEKFKTKFLDMKGKYEKTKSDLEFSFQRESDLENDVKELTGKLKKEENQSQQLTKKLLVGVQQVQEAKDRILKLQSDIEEMTTHGKLLEQENQCMKQKVSDLEEDLKVTKENKEILEEELAAAQQKLEASKDRLNEVEDDLSLTKEELQKVSARADISDIDLQKLEKRKGELEKESESLSKELETIKLEATTLRSTNAKLQTDFDKLSNQAKLSDEKVVYLSNQLERLADDLDITKTSLETSEQNGVNLKTKLDEMTSRADDAESISKQRMEVLQSTKEELEETNVLVQTLQLNEESMTKSIQQLNEEIKTVKGQLSQSEDKYSESQMALVEKVNEVVALTSSVQVLQDTVDQKKNDILAWSEKVSASDNLAEKLQSELSTTRELLQTTQDKLKAKEEDAASLNSQMKELEKINVEMETGLENAIKARAEEVDVFQAKIRDLQEQLTSKVGETEAKLMKRVQQQTEEKDSFQKELLQSQEKLNECQIALRSVEHREKMLKLQTTSLEDEKTELEGRLAELEALRESLETTGHKNIEDLKEQMTQMLEEERQNHAIYRESSERHLQELVQKSSDELQQAKKEGQERFEKAQKDFNDKMQKVESENIQKLEELKKVSEETNNKLVAKGKEMLKDVRQKARDEIESLADELEETKQELKKVEGEKSTISKSYTSKVSEYKKKLSIAGSRITRLSEETDTLKEDINRLEREKFRLREENDRYKRQAGGRFGADSNSQNQVEVLQKEFRGALDEIKELKQKLNNQGSSMISLPPIDEEGEGVEVSYSRNTVNQTTLAQLRNEYEETIDALNDEKRELVMKNSAAITDVQKAEKRAWESDQENSSLKKELTSLKLKLERFEHQLGNGDISMSSFDHDLQLKNTASTSLLSNSSFMSEISGLDENNGSVSNTKPPLAILSPSHRGEHRGRSSTPRRSSPSMKDIAGLGKSPSAKGFVMSPKVGFPASSNTSNSEAPPECKQC